MKFHSVCFLLFGSFIRSIQLFDLGNSQSFVSSTRLLPSMESLKVHPTAFHRQRKLNKISKGHSKKLLDSFLIVSKLSQSENGYLSVDAGLISSVAL
jgi:hypothetical protein